MKPKALFTTSDSRHSFMSALSTDRFVSRGSTFAHFAAIHIAVWADMQEVYEDAGKLLANEIALALREPPPSFVRALLHQSPTLQMEVRKALAPGRAKIDVDFAQNAAFKTRAVRYTVPTGAKLTALYHAIIREALEAASLDLRDKLAEVRQYREEHYTDLDSSP